MISELIKDATSRQDKLALTCSSYTNNNRLDAFVSTITEICGDKAKISTDDSTVLVHVDGKEARIDSKTMQITCEDDLLLHLLSSIGQKISQGFSTIV